MGGKTATTTSQVQIPPEVLARYNSVNATAQQAASQPFQAYSSDPNAFVAPLNAEQNAGIANINASANSYQPYYGAATGMTLAGAGAANPTALNAAAINQYMSPYLSDVVGSTAALLNQQNQQQQSGQLGTAIQSGAFGGDRAGIAAANLGQQQQMANANILSGLLNQGYNTALSTAQQQQGVDLGAQQANLARLQGAGAQLAGLGSQAQAAGLAGANAQLQAGTLGQQTQQAGLSALYNQFQQQQAYPFQTAQFLANIAEGTGALSGSTTTSTQPVSFLGSIISDRRAKEDIREVGKAKNGLNIYAYRYKGDPEKVTHLGFMADEVEEKRPEAVVHRPDGLAAVNYDRASRASGGNVMGAYGAPVGSNPYAESYVPAAWLGVGGLQTAEAPRLGSTGGLGQAAQAVQSVREMFPSWFKSDGGAVGYANGGLAIAQPPQYQDDTSQNLQGLASLANAFKGASQTGAQNPVSTTGYVPAAKETGQAPGLAVAQAPQYKDDSGQALGDIAKIAAMFMNRGGRAGYADGGAPDQVDPATGIPFSQEYKDPTALGAAQAIAKADPTGAGLSAPVAVSAPQNVGTPSTPQPAPAKIDPVAYFNNRIIPIESGGQQFDKSGQPLTSSAGAVGIAQVMPGTGPEAAKLAGLEWDPQKFANDPNYNKALGQAYFLQQYKTFGDPELAAAAYNAGPGAVQDALDRQAALGGDWRSYLPQETQGYVAKASGQTGQAQQPQGGLMASLRGLAGAPQGTTWWDKNQSWLQPVLSGLGAAEASGNLTLGGTLLAGLGGAEEGYMKYRGQQQDINAKAIDNLNNMYQTWQGIHAQDPTVSFADFAKSVGYGGTLPSGIGAGAAAPANGAYAYTPQEFMSNKVGENGLPISSDPAYLQTWLAKNAPLNNPRNPTGQAIYAQAENAYNKALAGTVVAPTGQLTYTPGKVGQEVTAGNVGTYNTQKAALPTVLNSANQTEGVINGLTDLLKSGDLVTGAFTGDIANVNKYLAAVGAPQIKGGDAASAQEALKYIASLNANNISKVTGGDPTSYQIAEVQGLKPDVSLTPQAMARLLSLLKAQNNYMRDYSAAMSDEKNMAQYNYNTSAFANAFSKKHPFADYVKQAQNEIGDLAGQAPAAPEKAGAPVQISSDADYEKLPSGSLFIGPDGKTRRKP